MIKDVSWSVIYHRSSTEGAVYREAIVEEGGIGAVRQLLVLPLSPWTSSHQSTSKLEILR